MKPEQAHMTSLHEIFGQRLTKTDLNLLFGYVSFTLCEYKSNLGLDISRDTKLDCSPTLKGFLVPGPSGLPAFKLKSEKINGFLDDSHPS